MWDKATSPPDLTQLSDNKYANVYIKEQEGHAKNIQSVEVTGKVGELKTDRENVVTINRKG